MGRGFDADGTPLVASKGAAAGHWRPAYAAVLLFVLALAPRVIAHERFVTVDETAHWVRRTEGFLDGLRTLDPAKTNQAPHPGVTTMWAASSGLAVHEALAAADLREDTREKRLAAMRLPVALIVSGAIAAAFLLLRRVADERAAFVGALLWAGEPFLVGHSRIVHVDAMVSSWLTLCLLAGFVAIREEKYRWWAISGVLGAVAFLSKLPAAIALPFLTLPLAHAAWGRRPRRPVERELGLWAVTFAGAFVLLWPAIPFATFGAAQSVGTGVEWAVSPHERGNFFLGEPVDDPGMLFYPVAVALRLAPWTALGVLAAALLWRRVDPPVRWFFLYVVLFLLFVALQAKKFDRYALPVFPWLDLLAGAGLVALWDTATRGVGLPARRRLELAATTALGALLAANLAWAHPYELLWYDPLLGGGKTAQKVVLVGWGEGMDEAGDWIRENAGCDVVVAAHHATREVLKPFVCQKVVTLEHARQAEIVVLYVNQIQRDQNARLTARMRKIGPAHVVRRAGIDLVEIYDLRGSER
jgi:hypothetical protein